MVARHAGRRTRCCRSITRCWRWRTWMRPGSGSSETMGWRRCRAVCTPVGHREPDHPAGRGLPRADRGRRPGGRRTDGVRSDILALTADGRDRLGRALRGRHRRRCHRRAARPRGGGGPTHHPRRPGDPLARRRPRGGRARAVPAVLHHVGRARRPDARTDAWPSTGVERAGIEGVEVAGDPRSPATLGSAAPTCPSTSSTGSRGSARSPCRSRDGGTLELRP